MSQMTWNWAKWILFQGEILLTLPNFYQPSDKGVDKPCSLQTYAAINPINGSDEMYLTLHMLWSYYLVFFFLNLTYTELFL